jgi:hypothetical protein
MEEYSTTQKYKGNSVQCFLFPPSCGTDGAPSSLYLPDCMEILKLRNLR